MEEEDERVCGNCRFYTILWDGCADSNKWLGICRLHRVEWRRGFTRSQGYEPTDLDMDDYVYVNMQRADTPGCGRFDDEEG